MSIDKLFEVMERLLDKEKGCPWVSAQTHDSLTTHVIEEAYEAANAMESGDDEGLRDELGDLLLQVVLHAMIAKERGAFTFDDVARTITDKLIRRYPTILGDEPNTLRTPEEIFERWDQVKQEERAEKHHDKEETSILDSLTTSLPALLCAMKMKRLAAAAGWEWENPEQILDKVQEELDEIRVEVAKGREARQEIGDEIGDTLFVLADLARWFDLDPEDSLRRTIARTEKRIRYMEAGLKAKGLDFQTSTGEDRHTLWQEAKADEKRRRS